jgi:uncharacterized protein involved in exopolysaccharide biosynthesis
MTSETDNPTWVQLLPGMVDYRWFAIKVAGAVLGFTVLGILLIPKNYESAMTLTAASQGSGADSRLVGLAAQFGLGDALGGRGSGTTNIEVIGQIVASPNLYLRLLDDTIAVADPAGPKTVYSLITRPAPGSGPITPLKRYKAAKKVLGRVAVAKNKLANNVTITVKTRWPALSQHVANAILSELNQALVRVGRMQAVSETDFISKRIATQERVLRDAESALGAFVRANREYRNSPTLTFEQERLQRAVTLKQQVLTGLLQSREDAQLRAIRDTPVLVAISPPQLPVEPAPRGRLIILLFGLILAPALAVFSAYARVMLREFRARNPQLWQALASPRRPVS